MRPDISVVGLMICNIIEHGYHVPFWASSFTWRDEIKETFFEVLKESR